MLDLHSPWQSGNGSGRVVIFIARDRLRDSSLLVSLVVFIWAWRPPRGAHACICDRVHVLMLPEVFKRFMIYWGTCNIYRPFSHFHGKICAVRGKENKSFGVFVSDSSTVCLIVCVRLRGMGKVQHFFLYLLQCKDKKKIKKKTRKFNFNFFKQ